MLAAIMFNKYATFFSLGAILHDGKKKREALPPFFERMQFLF
jgi:hypothetical protein